MLFEHSLREMLLSAATIAIVGASDKPSHPVDGVGRYLIAAGFCVIPVHPARPTVWGLPAFRSVVDITVPVDIVCLFRAAQHCPEHALEVLRLQHKPAVFWMQQGIVSPEASAIMGQAGVRVVQNECLKIVHQNLLAGSGL